MTRAHHPRARPTIPASWPARLPACERVVSVPYAHPEAGHARASPRRWPARGLSPYPVDLWRCRVPALRARVRERLAAGVDLCVADFLVAEPNVPLAHGRARRALRAQRRVHDLEAALHEVERRPWRRALLAVEWRKMRRYEARACARARPHGRRLRGRPRACWPPALRAPTSGPSRPASTPPTSTRTARARRRPRSSSPDPWTGTRTRTPSCTSCDADPARRSGGRSRGSRSTVVGRTRRDRLRAAAAAAGRPRHRHGGRRAALRGGGGGLRRAAAGRRRHAAQDLRGAGHGQGGGRRPGSAPRGCRSCSGQHFLQADSPADFAQAVVSLLRDADRRRALGAWPAAGWSRSATRGRRSRGEFESHCEEVVAQPCALASSVSATSGCVTAACLARAGHDVIGVDINPDKVAMVNAGTSPLVEPGLGELLAEVVAAGRLRATTSTRGGGRRVRPGADLRRHAEPGQRPARRRPPSERVAEQIGQALRRQPQALHRGPPQHRAARHDRIGPACRRSRGAGAAAAGPDASRSTRSSCARARRCGTSPSRP